MARKKTSTRKQAEKQVDPEHQVIVDRLNEMQKVIDSGGVVDREFQLRWNDLVDEYREKVGPGYAKYGD